jgi:PAS domain S-box-containing protein
MRLLIIDESRDASRRTAEMTECASAGCEIVDAGDALADQEALAAERAQAEAAREQNSAVFEALYNQMTEGVVLFDPEGHLLDMNQTALEIHGFDAVDTLKRHLEALTDTFELLDLAGTPLPTEAWPIGRVLRGETFERYEVRVRRPDTGRTWIGSYGGTPVYGPGGELLLAIVTLRDVTAQHEAEEEREGLLSRNQSQRQLLETVLAQMPSGVVVAEVPSGRALLGNARVNRIWRKAPSPPPDLEDYAAYRGFHPDGTPFAPEDWPLARAAQHGEVITEEDVAIERDDGTRGVIRISATPVVNDLGRVTAAVAVFYDVTEHLELLAEVQRQAAELSAMFEALPDALMFQGPSGEILRQNRAAERMVGYTPAEAALPYRERWARMRFRRESGEPLTDLQELPPPRALRGETVQGMVLGWRRRPTDAERWFSVSAAPVKEPEGQIIGAVSTFADITDLIETRHQSEDANAMLEEQALQLEEQADELSSRNERLVQLSARLNAERHLLQTIYDTVPVMFAIYDPAIEEVALSKHVHTVTGWTPEDTAETHIMELAYPDPDYRKQVADYMQSLQPGFRDIRMVAKDGGVIESSWANVQLPDGRQVGIGIDITARKQAETRLAQYTAELEEANQANRLLLQEVNHRVKNNLTAILGLIMKEQIHLDQEMPNRDEKERYLAALDNLSGRVRSLATAHSLLSASGWRPLELSDLARNVIEASLSAAGSEDTHPTVQINGSAVYVAPENAHNLALVLGELTTNTMKYGRGEGGVHVTVDINAGDGEVRLLFRDNGPGYPDSVLAGDDRSVGLGLVQSVVTHSLRGSWHLRNEGGAVVELRFASELTLNREAACG